jgi:hypothetical protein
VSVSHASNDFEVRRSIRFENCDHMQLMDVYDMLVWPASVNDYGAPYVEFSNVRSRAGRISGYTAWAAGTAYALGTIISGNNGLSAYKCIQAGTSGAASAAITGSISGNTLTVLATNSGTISIGQKIKATSGAVINVTTTSGSVIATVNSTTSGKLVAGQRTGGSGVPPCTIQSFGTYTTATGTGTINLSAAATSSTTLTLICNATSPVLEDTIITGGSGTTWTVNRAQSVASMAMTLTGAPQSASTSIPDGTAIWAFYGNDGRDYFNDGIAISPNYQGMSARPATKRRIAEFGGGLPMVGGPTAEVIIPPGAIITGAWLTFPTGAVGSYNPGDWLIELDDGTVILPAYVQFAAQGLTVSVTGLAIAVGTSMQRRKIRLIAGGAYGGNTDQVIAIGRAGLDYIA